METKQTVSNLKVGSRVELFANEEEGWDQEEATVIEIHEVRCGLITVEFTDGTVGEVSLNDDNEIEGILRIL